MARLSLTAPKTLIVLPAGSLALAAIVVFAVAGCSKKPDQSTVASGPKMFASPDEASSAVYTAAKSGDGQALIAIFGSNATELIISGDPVQDKAGR